MFCVKCGKTLKDGALQCPYCYTAVGETRFIGLSYTSCQTVTRPGDAFDEKTAAAAAGSTETAKEEGRTAYRVPEEKLVLTEAQQEDLHEKVQSGVLEDKVREIVDPDELSDDVRENVRQTMRQFEEDLDEDSFHIDRKRFEVKPITTQRQRGISREVGEYIREIDEEAEKAAEKEIERSPERKAERRKERADMRREKQLREEREEIEEEERLRRERGEEPEEPAMDDEDGDLGEERTVKKRKWGFGFKKRKGVPEEQDAGDQDTDEQEPDDQESDDQEPDEQGSEEEYERSRRGLRLLDKLAGFRARRVIEDDEEDS